MNCRQGDLAYVVGATTPPEPNGRIVRVARPFLKGEWFPTVDGGRAFCRPRDCDPAWVIESTGPLPWRNVDGTELVWVHSRPIRDSRLRPIRDQPGEDEMLTLVGKPQDVVAHGEGVS